MSITFQTDKPGVHYLKAGDRIYYYLEEETAFRIRELENEKVIQEETFADRNEAFETVLSWVRLYAGPEPDNPMKKYLEQFDENREEQEEYLKELIRKETESIG